MLLLTGFLFTIAHFFSFLVIITTSFFHRWQELTSTTYLWIITHQPLFFLFLFFGGVPFFRLYHFFFLWGPSPRDFLPIPPFTLAHASPPLIFLSFKTLILYLVLFLFGAVGLHYSSSWHFFIFCARRYRNNIVLSARCLLFFLILPFLWAPFPFTHDRVSTRRVLEHLFIVSTTLKSWFSWAGPAQSYYLVHIFPPPGPLDPKGRSGDLIFTCMDGTESQLRFVRLAPEPVHFLGAGDVQVFCEFSRFFLYQSHFGPSTLKN